MLRHGNNKDTQYIGVILVALIVGAVIRRGFSLSYAPIPTANYLSECMQMNVSIFLIDAFYVVFQFLGVVI
jgi:uncharacterized membrane protein YczE